MIIRLYHTNPNARNSYGLSNNTQNWNTVKKITGVGEGNHPSFYFLFMEYRATESKIRFYHQIINTHYDMFLGELENNR
jgi:hypothetical protein